MLNKTFGRYIGKDSKIHLLNPKIKIICFFLQIVMAWISNQIEIQLVLLVFFLLLILQSEISFFLFWKPIWKMKYLLLGICFIEIVTKGFSAFLVVMIMKVVNIMLSSTLYLVSTKQKEIMIGIDFLLSPLNIFSIPTDPFSFLISNSILFLPTLFYEFDKTTKTLTCRGIDYEHSNWKEKFQILSFIIFPLITNVIKKADSMSDIMELQGFQLGEKRTSYLYYSFYLFDWLYLIYHIGFLIVIIKGVML